MDLEGFSVSKVNLVICVGVLVADVISKGESVIPGVFVLLEFLSIE